MAVKGDAATFTVDFTELQTMAAVALNRWAHKNHLSARLKLAEEQNISPRTVDDWVQGTRPVPQDRLARLIVDLDEGFAVELVREMARRGKFSWLARIFIQHIQRILEGPDAPRTRNRNGRNAHTGNTSSVDCGLDRVGRPVKN